MQEWYPIVLALQEMIEQGFEDGVLREVLEVGLVGGQNELFTKLHSYAITTFQLARR
jgi:hypothetical protein